MKRTMWIMVIIVLLLISRRGVVAAQEPVPTLQVTVGFGGYCHGSWCAMCVVISNEGADVEGELRVDSSHGNTYKKRVVLPAHSRKAYFVYFGASSDRNWNVRLVSGGRELALERVSVRWLAGEDRLYGVVGDDVGDFDFLEDVDLASVGVTANVAHFDLESLPPEPLAWEGLDVLILNDVDTTVLDNDQRWALEAWVAHGGHLVVGGGAGASRTAAGIVDLLPVTVGGARSVDNLEALDDLVGVSSVAGPYVVAEAALSEGRALIQQDSLILMARRSYGAGLVDFVAFDLGQNPFTSDDGIIRLWRQIIDSQPRPPLLSVQGQSSAAQAIVASSGIKPIPVWQICCFTVAYALLAGPVSYLVLRKLGRREWGWFTVPALILGFTLCAYLMGVQARGGRTFIRRLAVIYVPRNSRIGRESQIVGLSSPWRRSYDVRVESALPRPLDLSVIGGLETLQLYEEANASMIEGFPVDVGDIQPFIADGYVEVPAVEADLHLVGAGSTVQGIVRNGGIGLEDAVLIAGYGERSLGDLEPGEVISVTYTSPSGLASSLSMMERIMGGVPWDLLVENPDLYSRYLFLTAVFEPGVASYGPYYPVPSLYTPLDSSIDLTGGVYLVGWASPESSPVQIEGRSSAVDAAVFYVYELPVAGPVGGEGGVSLPAAFWKRSVVGLDGSIYRTGSGLQFQMEFPSEIVFQFSAGPEMAWRRVEDLKLVVQNSGLAKLPAAVSLWNWSTGGWELVNMGPLGRLTLQEEDAGAYVTFENTVLVRLETVGGEASVDYMTLEIRGR